MKTPSAKTDAATIRSEFYSKLKTTRANLAKIFAHHEEFDTQDLVLEMGDIKNSPNGITHATVLMNDNCNRFYVKFYTIKGVNITKRVEFKGVSDTEIHKLFVDQIGLNIQ